MELNETNAKPGEIAILRVRDRECAMKIQEIEQSIIKLINIKNNCDSIKHGIYNSFKTKNNSYLGRRIDFITGVTLPEYLKTLDNKINTVNDAIFELKRKKTSLENERNIYQSQLIIFGVY